MGPFEMVVLIVALGVLGQVAKRYFDSKAKTDSTQTAELELLRIQVAKLQDRVQVLERLATDRSSRLAQDIDALRHQPGA
jgi:Na+-transporting methylmalonyl-CoA/oxaloacetate decarboxylase gamma subunit